MPKTSDSYRKTGKSNCLKGLRAGRKTR